MIRYSVACRGSLNEKSAKCFQGGGWVTDTSDPPCPHCGKPMFSGDRRKLERCADCDEFGDDPNCYCQAEP